MSIGSISVSQRTHLFGSRYLVNCRGHTCVQDFEEDGHAVYINATPRIEHWFQVIIAETAVQSFLIPSSSLVRLPKAIFNCRIVLLRERLLAVQEDLGNRAGK